MSVQDHRKEKLLLFLSNNQDYVTADELADILQTSQKTVYRLIKKINEESTEHSMIVSEKGRGYTLDYEKFMNYQKNIRNDKEDNFSPEERRKRVMEELLLSSPKAINIHQLFSDYYVGDSVIFTDEQTMSEELKKYDLTLERKNRTIAVLGEETNIRKAMKEIIEIFNIIDIDDLKTNPELNFNKYDVLFILDQLRNIEKNLNITIPYPYNINIFSHLYILLSRSRKSPDFPFAGQIDQEKTEMMKKDADLKEVAEVTVCHMERYLHQTLPDIEVYFLYQYLVSSRMQGTFDVPSNFSTGVIQVTDVYMKEMSARLGITIDNQSIFNDLANHIKPMLNRLEHKIRIKNRLLGEIKVTYEEIFSRVKKVSECVSETFHLPAINDDENGFITLYFAKMMETSQHQPPIQTLIMCTTGIGTSELLKAKASKKFPELEIVDVVATRDTKSLKKTYSDVELIISTIHLEDEVPVKSLLVSAMFTMDDQKRLQQKIEEIYHER
ncbi:BglG family transcription antiterminator [Salibacterium qingdaonense]|uniref:Activator of the mannose operon, transcriptional antiterminator n=1 Tax=Salibacterium qingdaonense TaxID=266892 RepID=A0A1I4NHA9_9BACI|nr:PRD domain-containing protein [Salibacterium qingdaonense]SFM14942.1 activator of the mannose operon, transcriptional antiterminator [Salibacterium qingdaonense]